MIAQNETQTAVVDQSRTGSRPFLGVSAHQCPVSDDAPESIRAMRETGNMSQLTGGADIAHLHITVPPGIVEDMSAVRRYTLSGPRGMLEQLLADVHTCLERFAGSPIQPSADGDDVDTEAAHAGA